jgi:hypothetical protein
MGSNSDSCGRVFLVRGNYLFAKVAALGQSTTALRAVAVDRLSNAFVHRNGSGRREGFFLGPSDHEIVDRTGLPDSVRIGCSVHSVQLAAGALFADTGCYAHVRESGCGSAIGMGLWRRSIDAESGIGRRDDRWSGGAGGPRNEQAAQASLDGRVQEPAARSEPSRAPALPTPQYGAIPKAAVELPHSIGFCLLPCGGYGQLH